jgi:hypothetical protein
VFFAVTGSHVTANPVIGSPVIGSPVIGSPVTARSDEHPVPQGATQR